MKMTFQLMLLTGLLSGLLTMTSCAAPIAVQLITPEDAKALLASEPAVLLLDVRTQEEYDSGHIAGSVLMPNDEIETRSAELPADRATTIVVYCRSGRRSALAAETLLSLGYTKIYDLGGIQDWPYETVVD